MNPDDGRYWIIDYRLDFLSDFHVGSGITLVGANLHGLQLDENGRPLVPHTEIRGLLRLGGRRLEAWQPELCDGCVRRHFGAWHDRDADEPASGCWSFTAARLEPDEQLLEADDFLGRQSHVRLTPEGVVENLFSCQKAGPSGAGEDAFWRGRIYSRVPLDRNDVAFLVACLRAEDRIGHRRSRGYGRVAWRLERVRSWLPGEPEARLEDPGLASWLERFFGSDTGAERGGENG